MKYIVFLVSIPIAIILSTSRLAAQNPSGAIPSASRMEAPPTNADSATDSTNAIPEPDEFIELERFPEFDMQELYSKLRYPEEARTKIIEGKVTLMVFIDKDGFVRKTRVAQGADPFLEEAALDAVYRMTFTPGIQNGKPIGCWLSIPFTFTLK